MTVGKKRVLLGMSGGVDSSVAAHFLQRQGYEVIGVTMKVWPQDCMSRAEDKCCGPSAIADARGVAHRLRIPHYVVDEADRFEEIVIDYFASEYRAGRTPNPCVMCNEKLKFGSLWDKARSLGADFIATGHYAIVEHTPEGAILRRGIDSKKDQSYFLFSLSQEQLSRALTPLGELTKPEIRQIARELGLRVADKVDSQEICFVPGNDYKSFLKSHLADDQFHKGGIYDTKGKYLADHEGIEMFTIGQRKGLPGGSPFPLYVVDIDPENSRVIVGREEDLVRSEFEVERLNWLANDVTTPAKVVVKIRYSHPGTPATISSLPGGRARIVLDEPQRAITPGQAAVIYQGDRVIGGGWILRQTVVPAAVGAL
ncbi:MAG: tRNA 2-thiouridine(34) synthase MnmA [Terrimicrobiaceae bacterium]